MNFLSRRQFLTTTSALMTAMPARPLTAANANDEINIGFVSCGGRAGQLMSQVTGVAGVNVAGLCDADGINS